MSKYLIPRNRCVKQNNILSATRDVLTSVVWRDKPDIRILKNMCPPPTNDNMCNELGNAIQPEFIQDYNRCISYVDLMGLNDKKKLLNTKPDIKVDKKFSYFLRMTALNSFLLLTVYRTEMTHPDFQLCMCRT